MAAVAQSPHQLRLLRREAQAKVRTGLNTILAAQDDWEADQMARAAAGELTNAILSSRYLTDQRWGVLALLPGLQAAAKLKYWTHQARSIQTMSHSLEAMTAAVALLRETASSVTALGPDSAGQRQAVYPGAVFANLTISTLGAWFCEISRMYEEDLEVMQQLGNSLYVFWGAEAGKGDGLETQQLKVRATEDIRSNLEVLLATWMLHPKMQEARRDDIIGTIMEEMRGF
ncbi:hypothetical protein WJX72_010486 [[Myrmecia] bisecta]|uniref:Uncharacterized protein n=1 Tax=[Myrmecia] bisecta TaxID=41462 RepID=A0AAW1R8X6_9CHLO